MVDNVIIMGAAGRDFHNFNTYFRNNPDYNVVAFTATQIPNIHGRMYPAVLAGEEQYPDGISIHPEEELAELITKHDVKQVIFSYSDVAYEDVMHKCAMVNAAGADFRLMSLDNTVIKSKKPVISICAVRTGAGKSPTTRRVCKILRDKGLKVVAIRHPMPYGDLTKQIWQRFETIEDLEKHNCTIEEMEEYEPHINIGIIVYAGVDYGEILSHAEEEADVIVWDGGNNDLPFYKPDLQIVITDPHRPGHELRYYPGETNLRLADVAVINKIKTADAKNIEIVRNNIKTVSPNAQIVEAHSPIEVENPDEIKGKKVLVVEDGPTVTHGEMSYGAGFLAAKEFGAGEIIDPRPYAQGSLKDTFEKYTHIESVLPAMGYGQEQVADLEATINAAECDIVLSGTPIDLGRLVKLNKPMIRVKYSMQEQGKPDLVEIIDEYMKKHNDQ
jgi:predicted GTPase